MRHWKTQEVDYLKSVFNSKSNKEIASELGFTVKRVAKKVSALGLKRDYQNLFPDIQGEVWKEYPNNENYKVSNEGRIKNSLNNRILKP